MHTITFANTKGGAGKTTVSLIVAAELAHRGFRVTVLDTDPQQWISRWQSNTAGSVNFTVVSAVTENTIEAEVKALKRKSDYVIIDVESGLTALMAKAIGLSDHVLIPVQGCAMDAAGGAQVLNILQQLDAQCGIRIAHSVILTRISSIISTRALTAVKALLAEQQVHLLDTALIERAAYRDMFVTGGTLYTMDATRVSNLDKARENARLLADEVISLLPVKASKPKSAKKEITPSATAKTQAAKRKAAA